MKLRAKTRLEGYGGNIITMGQVVIVTQVYQLSNGPVVMALKGEKTNCVIDITTLPFFEEVKD